MSLAIVHSRAQVGIEAPAVTVEAHLANDDRRLADFLARCTPPARFTRTSVDALSGESARTDPAEA